jgi:hypothetical protein
LLYALVGLVIALGALLRFSLYHRHAPVHTAVATSAGGVVTLVPEGLLCWSLSPTRRRPCACRAGACSRSN